MSHSGWIAQSLTQSSVISHSIGQYPYATLCKVMEDDMIIYLIIINETTFREAPLSS